MDEGFDSSIDSSDQRQRTVVGRRAFLAGVGALTASVAGCSAIRGQGTGATPDLRVAYDGAPPHFQAIVMDHESLYDGVPAILDRKEASCKSIVQLLVSGTADVGMIGIIPALVAIDKGPPMHVVSASSSDAFVIMARAGVADRFEAGEDHPIEAFADANGRTFKLGTYPKGSVSDITARYWLSDVIDTPDEAVSLVPLGGPGAARQALLAGEVDGAVIPEPTPTLIESRADRYRRIGWVGNFIPGEPAGVTVVRDDYAEAHPDAVEGFIEQHAAASQFITDKPEQTAAYMSEVYGGANTLDPATALQALRSRATKYLTDPSKIRDGTAVMAEYAADLGKTDRAYDPSAVFEPKYYEAIA